MLVFHCLMPLEPMRQARQNDLYHQAHWGILMQGLQSIRRRQPVLAIERAGYPKQVTANDARAFCFQYFQKKRSSICPVALRYLSCLSRVKGRALKVASLTPMRSYTSCSCCAPLRASQAQ